MLNDERIPPDVAALLEQQQERLEQWAKVASDLEEEVALLQAELESAEMTSPDEHMAEENARLTEENDRLRAEVAQLKAALNGTLVEGVPA